MQIRQHTFFPAAFPESWASDWGEDEYGLWMGFTYKGVRHDFRWIEPGTFTMGSPKNEPERDDDETQCEVTLTEGFWLAETTVTQALWKTVMGDDPSHFDLAQQTRTPQEVSTLYSTLEVKDETKQTDYQALHTPFRELQSGSPETSRSDRLHGSGASIGLT